MCVSWMKIQVSKMVSFFNIHQQTWDLRLCLWDPINFEYEGS